MSTKKQTTDVVNITPIENVEKQFNLAVKQFDVNKAKVKKWAKQFDSLQINGIDDREGYNAVVEAIATIRTARTGTDKVRKSLGEDARTYVNMINDHAKGLTSELTPIEEKLKAEKQKIDDEKERIKKAAELAAQKRIDDRINLLLKRGMNFDGNRYYLQVDEEQVILSVSDVHNMGDEDFAEKESEIDALCLLIAEKEIETERLKKEEEERIEKQRLENEKNAAELAALQKEFEAQQAAQQKKLAEQQAALQAQQDAIDKQKAEQAQIEIDKKNAEIAEAKRLQDIEDAKVKAEQERLDKEAADKAAEQKRLNELPDVERLNKYLDSVKNAVDNKPVIKTETINSVAQDFCIKVSNYIKKLKSENETN